jgi:hypothetical protein
MAGGHATTGRYEGWGAREATTARASPRRAGSMVERRCCVYFTMTPQAIRAPLLPVGSVFSSSGAA